MLSETSKDQTGSTGKWSLLTISLSLDSQTCPAVVKRCPLLRGGLFFIDLSALERQAPEWAYVKDLPVPVDDWLLLVQR